MDEISEEIPNHEITKEGELLPKIRLKLEQVIESKGLKDFQIDVSAGSGVGDNFLGFIGKIVIKGRDSEDKKHTWNWIVKTAPTQTLYRTTFKVDILYNREVYMYEKVFPIFSKFQSEKSVSNPFDNYPKIIFSYLEPYNECFAMENMKTKGYIMRSRREVLDLKHVKLVVEAYAKMHAISYAIKDQNRELFDELKENLKDSMTASYSKESAKETIQMHLDKALDSLDEKTDAKTYEKFKKICPNFIDSYYQAVENPSEYAVIGHGDSWVNNMLWLYNNPKKPTDPSKVCLLDFQLSKYGSPACDLSYFLFTCTDKALREAHYDTIIKLYYYHLCQQLVEMGSDPERCLPFPRLIEELERFAIAGLYFTIMVLSIITKESSEIPNLREGNKKMEDFKDEWMMEGKNHGEYCRRVRGCLIDFEEKGYFDYHLNV